jgi:benzoyl-CoA-dihydrodiol lyase
MNSAIAGHVATLPERVDFATHPSRYRHWKLSFDGPLATLALDVAEDGGIRPGYKLKLNSYDLGVDIELHDALQRIRFEHPEVRTVVMTGARDRVFCSGANIFMLGSSSHAWKVNFCKFTNETRNGIEDSSRHSGLKFIAAVNGACAGGGYELALACDEILLVDDRSSAVSLPEGAAARRAARHGRTDATDRQAQGAARSRRHLLHHDRRRARAARQRLAARR